MEGQASELLSRWRAGDRAARDELAPLVAAELRRVLGEMQVEAERTGRPLVLPALVAAACSRLAGDGVASADRARLASMTCAALRSMLGARERSRRAAWKRAGPPVALAESLAGESWIDLLRLDGALAALGARDRRAERVLELFFLGGLTPVEIGSVLELTPATVDRDLLFGCAWLERELAQRPAPGPGLDRRRPPSDRPSSPRGPDSLAGRAGR